MPVIPHAVHTCLHLPSIKYVCLLTLIYQVNIMLNKNTLGVKKVRGQSEAALQIGMYDQKL